MGYATEQEAFWAGSFGADYLKRNQGEALLAANLKLFSDALRQAPGLESCVEFGANIGMNLRAIQILHPGIQARAIEINEQACVELAKVIGEENVTCGSIYDASVEPADLALIKGVLIHQNPDKLPEAYERVYRAAKRFIMVCEYYNPTPVAIPYRGHNGRLFKRDFAGEMMDTFPDLRLVDYGFVYHRDPAHPQDDATWFLMEKAGG